MTQKIAFRKKLALMLVISIFCNHSLVFAQAQKIEIGVIIPLSGGWKIWGDHIHHTLEMFANENSNSIKINFNYQDEGTCDSNKAFQAYKFLRATKQIKYFILGCMNGARAILPLANKDKVLLFSAGFEESNLFSNDGALINFALQIDSEAQQLSQFIESSQVKRLALLRSSGTDDIYKSMKNFFMREKKVTIVCDQAFQGDEINLESDILKIRQNHADGVFLNLSEQQLQNVLRKMFELKIEAKLFSSYGISVLASNNPEIAQLAKGLVYTYPSISLDTRDFDARFHKLYGLNPVITNYFLYDGLHKFERALNNCQDVNNLKCVRDQISNATWETGLSGDYKINQDGSIERKFMRMEIQ